MPKPKEESTVRFIEYVRFNELLWDKSNPDRKDFQKRTDAWNSIAVFCGFENGELAKKKWKHLTTARAGAQKAAGIDNEDTHASDYLYASEMSFLDGIKRAKRSRSSHKFAYLNFPNHNEIAHSSQNDVIVIEDDQSQSGSNGKVEEISAKFPQTEDSVELTETNVQLLRAIEAAINGNNRPGNEDESDGMLFGRLIGHRLNRLDARKRALAQIEIQNLLYKYEFDD